VSQITMCVTGRIVQNAQYARQIVSRLAIAGGLRCYNPRMMDRAVPEIDLAAWWAARMAEGKSAVEAAREFGVNIEQLRLMRRRTPLERLRLLQAMAQFLVAGRASILRQKERERLEREA
jgi:hypothetical protein